MYGFSEPLLSWLHSFISDRTQNVKHENYLSEHILITSSVPKGYHLFPIQYCVFINNISDVISRSKIVLLAGDTKIHKDICSLKDALKLH